MNQVFRRLLLLLAVTATTNSQFQNSGMVRFPLHSHRAENELLEEKFFYFDIDLLKEIAHTQPRGNILISPLSIKSTLAMILEGSSGDSATELSLALRISGDKKRVREEFRELLSKFHNPKRGVTLKMANRVFLSNRLTPLDEYQDTLNKYYNSNMTKVDFTSPVQSAATINKWVNEETNGIIPSLVNADSFGGQISILLANALYFKGIWQKAFKESATTVKCFYRTYDDCYNTPMMELIENIKYDDVKNLDAKVIELPYSGNEYSMVVVLPNKRDGVQQLTRDIRTSINTIVEHLNTTEVLVVLPRFKIDYHTDLVSHLPKVHVSKIFSPHALLNGIVQDAVDVRVSNVLHKTSIDVNEQGTEAAAATGAEVIPLMSNIKPSFRADHPFLFFIRHIPTGTILFEGRVSEPEPANPDQTIQQEQQPRQQPNLQHNQQSHVQQQPHLQPQPQQPTFLQQPYATQSQSSFVTQPQSFASQPQSFATQPQSFGTQQQPFASQPQQAFASQPQQSFASLPQQSFASQPQQSFVTQPQHTLQQAAQQSIQFMRKQNSQPVRSPPSLMRPLQEHLSQTQTPLSLLSHFRNQLYSQRNMQSSPELRSTANEERSRYSEQLQASSAYSENSQIVYEDSFDSRQR